MDSYYIWLEQNASVEDLIDGAFFNAQNGQWVIYDLDKLKRYIENA